MKLIGSPVCTGESLAGAAAKKADICQDANGIALPRALQLFSGASLWLQKQFAFRPRILNHRNRDQIVLIALFESGGVPQHPL
jgi:hypothetical protein